MDLFMNLYWLISDLEVQRLTFMYFHLNIWNESLVILICHCVKDFWQVLRDSIMCSKQLCICFHCIRFGIVPGWCGGLWVTHRAGRIEAFSRQSVWWTGRTGAQYQVPLFPYYWNLAPWELLSPHACVYTGILQDLE